MNAARHTHKTFEAYCRERWGFAKSYAYFVIGASSITKELPSTMVDKITTERQARELAKVPEADRPAVIQAAASTSKLGRRRILWGW